MKPDEQPKKPTKGGMVPPAPRDSKCDSRAPLLPPAKHGEKNSRFGTVTSAAEAERIHGPIAIRQRANPTDEKPVAEVIPVEDQPLPVEQKCVMGSIWVEKLHGDDDWFTTFELKEQLNIRHDPFPPDSYGELVIGNLDSLKNIARIHPRLAVVGVFSEMELVLGDVLGPHLARHEKRHQGYQHVENLVLTAQSAWRFHRNNNVPTFVKEFAMLFEDAPDYRHKRPAVSEEDSNEIIECAKLYVRALNRCFVPRVFECKSHPNQEPLVWNLSSVLNGAPNTEIKICCHKDAKEFYPLKIPIPDPRELK